MSETSQAPQAMPSTSTSRRREEAERRIQAGVDKQREILSKLIYPSHIPMGILPKSTSMAELILDLDAAGKSQDDSNVFSQDDIQALNRNSKNLKTTPFQEIKRIHQKCDIYLRQSKKYEKEFLKRKELGADKNSILESKAMTQIYEVNYRYCLSHVSCPQRMAILNNCYGSYSGEIVKKLAESGQLDYICKNERTAIERCCGQKVEAVMSQLFQEKR
eukprot:227757_1